MGEKCVRYQGIFRRDAISRCQAQYFGIRIQYLDISYLVISHDMGYDITIYRDISCDITPDHLETPGKYKFNENPPPRCGLLLFFSALSLPSSWLVLGLAFFVVFLLSISWPHHRTDHTTTKQQPRPLKTRPTPWAHVVLFHFSIFFSFLSFRLFSFLIPGTWYSLVVARFLIYIVVNVVGYFKLMICFCREIVDMVYAVHI